METSEDHLGWKRFIFHVYREHNRVGQSALGTKLDTLYPKPPLYTKECVVGLTRLVMWSHEWEAKFFKMEGMYVWDKNGESAFGG